MVLAKEKRMNLVTTDEKKPPEEAVLDARALIHPTREQQIHLIASLLELEAQFGRLTRRAGGCGEMKLMQELEKRWDDYALLIAPLCARAPSKLFE